MESLYVCLFSNGHIKVGRSIEPKSRIASHADRVACLGVQLSDSAIFECAGPAAPRELHLVGKCAEAATNRYQNEWFDGLDFLVVCEWARGAAALDALPGADNLFGRRLRETRVAAGITQTQLGKGLSPDGSDVLKATVSNWETGRCSPNLTQLRCLCDRLRVSADWLLGVESKVS